jgi:hypothetical protein
MFEFKGKVVLVTGGTSGIGRGAAVAFARAGAKVIVAGRRDAEGSETVREIEAAGGMGRFIRADVALESDIEALIARTLEVHGRLDIAFNNAGVELGGALTGVTEESYRRIFGINVWGVLAAMKHEINAMLKELQPLQREQACRRGTDEAQPLDGGFHGEPAVAENEGTLHGHLEPLAIPGELPGVDGGAAGLAPVDAGMLEQLLGSPRCAVAREVGRGGHRELAQGPPELHGDHVLVEPLAQAEARVEPPPATMSVTASSTVMSSTTSG